MDNLYIWVATFLMLNIIIGGYRIAKGPTKADRMMAGQFMASLSVAIFLLLAEAFDQPSLRNLALVFVALATLASVAFTQAFVKNTEPTSESALALSKTKTTKSLKTGVAKK